MLLFGSRLIDTPIMGLQTGRELARTAKPIVDPHFLKVIAYELKGPLLDTSPSLLRVVDIRELSDIGMIVDSSDEFIGLDDVIAVRQVYDIDFGLLGMHVKDERGNKLGKVNDYTVEIGSFVIQQLIVKKPLMKSINADELTIHRSQITEITNEYITVKSAESKPGPVKTMSRDYVNPFRSSSPQTNS